MSTYQNANPPARFGQYRAETSRIDAQDPGAQRLAEAFSPKNALVLRYWPPNLKVQT